MAIFLIVSGMSFSLFNQQQASAKLLQGQTALNVALRNAATLLQMDLAGAGSGYFQGVNMPSWPVGVTLVNNMGTPGTSLLQLGHLQLRLYLLRPNQYHCGGHSRAPIRQFMLPTVRAPAGGTNCSYTNAGTAYGQAAVASGTTWTLANTAAEFKAGDQLLFLNSSGTKITTVKLSSAPTVSGSTVKFTFNATNADGSNTSWQMILWISPTAMARRIAPPTTNLQICIVPVIGFSSLRPSTTSCVPGRAETIPVFAIRLRALPTFRTPS